MNCFGGRWIKEPKTAQEHETHAETIALTAKGEGLFLARQPRAVAPGPSVGRGSSVGTELSPGRRRCTAEGSEMTGDNLRGHLQGGHPGRRVRARDPSLHHRTPSRNWPFDPDGRTRRTPRSEPASPKSGTGTELPAEAAVELQRQVCEPRSDLLDEREADRAPAGSQRRGVRRARHRDRSRRAVVPCPAPRHRGRREDRGAIARG